MAINYSDGRSTGMYTYNIQANFIRPIKFNYNGKPLGALSSFGLE